jgi:hypothetical protein
MGFGLGGLGLAWGLLELVETALSFVGFPGEADSTAAQTENAC